MLELRVVILVERNWAMKASEMEEHIRVIINSRAVSESLIVGSIFALNKYF